jgi:two-component system OmpR family response regulator
MVNKIKIKDLKIDLRASRVFQKDKEIFLTPTEYKLLKHLALHKGLIQTRDMIISSAWEHDFYGISRNIDVYVGYIRKKIGNGIIQTRRGFGYFIEKGG